MKYNQIYIFFTYLQIWKLKKHKRFIILPPYPIPNEHGIEFPSTFVCLFCSYIHMTNLQNLSLRNVAMR